MKKIFYTELAYIFGVVSLAFGTALMEASDFGVSMVVAPAYLLYLKLSQTYEFFTFGMSEYILQGFLLILLMSIIRKFRISYLFSMITAVIYGSLLDVFMKLIDFIPSSQPLSPFAFYIIGMITCSAGVSLLFHTYIPPAVYELFVKEVSRIFRLDINKFKTFYDCTSCIVGIILSFSFFGLWNFEGIKVGTIFCAIFNGFLISRFTSFFEKHWRFINRLPIAISDDR